MDYDYLLGRVGGWSMLDLDDLLLEIETDKQLTEAERKALLARVYAILWGRVKPTAGPPGGGSPTLG